MIASEVDRSKLAKEVGVSSQTIYNVISDLRIHGYTLSIDVNSPKSTHPTSTPRSTSTPRTTQQPTQGEIESSYLGEATPQPTYPEEVQGNSKYYPGELPEESTSTQRASRRPTQAPGLSKQDVIEIVGEAMKQVADYVRPAEKRLPEEDMTGINLPIEDVQLSGEKVNYRIALNPEIFYRYTVFKARAQSLGKKRWEGTFADFVDMATKDILTVYGMYPTVITTRGRSFTVDLPQGVQEVDSE